MNILSRFFNAKFSVFDLVMIAASILISVLITVTVLSNMDTGNVDTCYVKPDNGKIEVNICSEKGPLVGRIDTYRDNDGIVTKIVIRVEHSKQE